MTCMMPANGGSIDSTPPICRTRRYRNGSRQRRTRCYGRTPHRDSAQVLLVNRSKCVSHTAEEFGGTAFQIDVTERVRKKNWGWGDLFVRPHRYPRQQRRHRGSKKLGLSDDDLIDRFVNTNLNASHARLSRLFVNVSSIFAPLKPI